MQKQSPRSFCAVAAIAAALALGSTAASAQDAGPAPAVPTIAPPAPISNVPAPVARISAPVVQAVPAAAAPEPVAAPRTASKAPSNGVRQAARAGTARTAAPIPASVPAAAPAPVAGAAAAAPLAAAPGQVTASDPAPRAEAVPIAQAQPPSNGLNGGEAGLIALLAAGGLAGAGFMVARSRRKRGDNDEFADTAPERRATVLPPPVVTADRVAPRRAEPAAERFAMPPGEMPTGAEREALLQRMVAADPDEANPFTSPRSRRKRARLILQHRYHLQHTHGAKPFDWRTYRSTEAGRPVEDPVPV